VIRYFLSVFFALLVLGRSAQAGTITIAYSGQIYGGGDNSGYYSGTVDGPFTGQFFTLTYTFNPSSVTDNGITSQFSSNSPTGYVDFTIGGLAPSYSDYSESDAASLGTTSQSAGGDLAYYHEGGLIGISTFATNVAIPESIFASYSVLTGLNGGGNFLVSEGTQGGAYGTLVLETLIVNGGSVAAVPEPSTWAMLLIGFAAIGVMTYRRKVMAEWPPERSSEGNANARARSAVVD
jgi:hypothetical protein